MKKAVLLLLLVSAQLSAQRFDLQYGSLMSLKGIQQYNLVFDYSNVKIHGYQTEEEFLQDKMEKREKTPGKAEQFREDWYRYRTERYEPAFTSYFNKMLKKDRVQVGQFSEAKYTMEVKTIWIYPGYNAGTAIEPAKISTMVTVRETANPDNVLVAILFEKAIGLEHELGNSLGDRISWAYEKVAKNFTIQLKRFL